MHIISGGLQHQSMIPSQAMLFCTQLLESENKLDHEPLECVSMTALVAHTVRIVGCPEKAVCHPASETVADAVTSTPGIRLQATSTCAVRVSHSDGSRAAEDRYHARLPGTCGTGVAADTST